MLFIHTFAYNQQLHKKDTQETLTELQIQDPDSIQLIYQLILHLPCCHFALLWVLRGFSGQMHY